MMYNVIIYNIYYTSIINGGKYKFKTVFYFKIDVHKEEINQLRDKKWYFTFNFKVQGSYFLSGYLALVANN